MERNKTMIYEHELFKVKLYDLVDVIDEDNEEMNDIAKSFLNFTDNEIEVEYKGD